MTSTALHFKYARDKGGEIIREFWPPTDDTTTVELEANTVYDYTTNDLDETYDKFLFVTNGCSVFYTNTGVAPVVPTTSGEGQPYLMSGAESGHLILINQL